MTILKSFFNLKSFFIFCWFIFPQVAFSSACNTPIVRSINFAQGSYCWTYFGKATDFVGNFRQGQNITVRLEGGNGEPGLPSVFSGSKMINSNNQSDNKLNFIAPFSGKYNISLGACYLWGENVRAEICAY